jgi:hypothetical protein
MQTRRILAALVAFLPLAAVALPSDATREMGQEIVAIKVDRALGVSQAQAQALLPLLQAGAASLASLRAANQAAQLAAMTKARDELVASGTVSDATKQELAAARRSSRSGIAQAAQALRQQVEQILTPAQIQAARQSLVRTTSAVSDGRGPGRRGAGQGHLVFALTASPFLKLLQARAG